MNSYYTTFGKASIHDREVYYLTSIGRNLFVGEEAGMEVGVYDEVSKNMYSLRNTIKAPMGVLGKVEEIVATVKGDRVAIRYTKEIIDGGEKNNVVYIFWNINGIWVMKYKAFPKYYEVGSNYGNKIALSRDGNILFVGAKTKENDQTTKIPGSTGSVYTYIFNERTEKYERGQMIRPAYSHDGNPVIDFGVDINTDNHNLGLYKCIEIIDGDLNTHTYHLKYKGEGKHQWLHDVENYEENMGFIHKSLGVVAKFIGSTLFL